MRLIEVSDLEKFIQENVCAIGNDHLLLVAGDDGRWHEALPLVPTAYDIDKVVKELEERTDFLKDCTKYGNKNAKQQAKSYSTMMMYEVAEMVDDLIEIVKQGSVSDDVCEWIKYDYRTICPKNHDANNPYWRIPDNTDKLKYCPYCGKKIKVVE